MKGMIVYKALPIWKKSRETDRKDKHLQEKALFATICSFQEDVNKI